VLDFGSAAGACSEMLLGLPITRDVGDSTAHDKSAIESFYPPRGAKSRRKRGPP
jgi:hypothetical protein